MSLPSSKSNWLNIAEMEVNKGEQAIKVLPLSSQKEKESFLTQADSLSHLQYLESLAL